MNFASTTSFLDPTTAEAATTGIRFAPQLNSPDQSTGVSFSQIPTLSTTNNILPWAVVSGLSGGSATLDFATYTSTSGGMA